jgi:hypothetical protein
MYMIEESLAIVGLVVALAAGLFLAAALLVLTRACARAVSDVSRRVTSYIATALAKSLQTLTVLHSERQ